MTDTSRQYVCNMIEHSALWASTLSCRTQYCLILKLEETAQKWAVMKNCCQYTLEKLQGHNTRSFFAFVEQEAPDYEVKSHLALFKDLLKILIELYQGNVLQHLFERQKRQ